MCRSLGGTFNGGVASAAACNLAAVLGTNFSDLCIAQGGSPRGNFNSIGGRICVWNQDYLHTKLENTCNAFNHNADANYETYISATWNNITNLCDVSISNVTDAIRTNTHVRNAITGVDSGTGKVKQVFDVTCGLNEYLKGFDALGQPICTPLPAATGGGLSAEKVCALKGLFYNSTLDSCTDSMAIRNFIKFLGSKASDYDRARFYYCPPGHALTSFSITITKNLLSSSNKIQSIGGVCTPMVISSTGIPSLYSASSRGIPMSGSFGRQGNIATRTVHGLSCPASPSEFITGFRSTGSAGNLRSMGVNCSDYAGNNIIEDATEGIPQGAEAVTTCKPNTVLRGFGVNVDLGNSKITSIRGYCW